MHARFVAPGLLAGLIALALALPAAAPAAEFTLTVNLVGEGLGEVECKIKEPGEEEYEENCEGVGKHLNNTTITIRTFPEEESSKFGSFENGTGSTVGCVAKTCSFKLTANSSVDARFDLREFNFKVKTAGTGMGEVECSAAGPYGPCAAKYPYGTEVALRAEADGDSDLAAWSEPCAYAEREEECELTVEVETTVTVTFDLQPKLTIEKKGTGAGSVECESFLGNGCEPHYPRGTGLVLLAESEEGSEFVKWEGGCDRIAGEECELELNADTTVKATFNLEPKSKLKLEVTKSGTGSGTIASTPAGIACGASCEHEYEEGAVVTLSQIAASGSEFKGWTGCTSEEAGKCKVAMSAAKAVSARFDAQPAGGGGSSGGSGGSGGTGGTGGSGGGGGGAGRTAPGMASAAGTATVAGGRAALRLSCTGGPCNGSLTLMVRVRQGGRAKDVVVGRAPLELAAGASTTLRIRLSAAAERALEVSGTLQAKAGGTGIAPSTVRLKLSGGARKRH